MSFNILIVDDSAAMRSIIGKTLRLSGLPLGEVHQAANGAEALDILEENWIDLALVDINMPVMDGETLINCVRDNPDIKDVAIIVVSTESSELRIEKLLEKNVEFIHKPFTPEILRQKVFSLTGVDYESSIESSSNFDF